MQTKIRLNSKLLPLLAALVLFMEVAEGSRVWMLALVGLGGAWLISFLWALSLKRNLSFKREMRFGWAQVGDALEERFTLHNSGLLPVLWAEVNDRSNMPEYQASSVTAVGSKATSQWRTRGVCMRRGLYTLGPTDVVACDPLGVYEVTLHDPSSAHLMVMPPVVPLPSIKVAAGGHSGDGRPRQNAPDRTVSAASVREYVPGDSLHTIHWPTTARRNAPYVHVFDGTPAGDWWVIVDLEKKSQVGQGWDATEEHAIILAASLAHSGLQMHHAVGLVANADNLVWLAPQEGEHYKWEILRALALVQLGSTSLSDLLQRLRPAISKRSSLVLITPNVTGDWLEHLVPMMWRGIVPTVLLLDPVSFGAPVADNRVADNAVAENAVVSNAMTGLVNTLAQMGVARYIITHDMLDKPQARPGRSGKWEWRVMPTGRAIPVNQPGDTTWKSLT